MQNDETTPKICLDMLKIYCKKRKQQKESEFQKSTQNRLVYDKLSPNLEPKVNDVQFSYNFRYSAISTQIDRIQNLSNLMDIVIIKSVVFFPCYS